MSPLHDIRAALRRTARRAEFSLLYGWRRKYEVEVLGTTTRFKTDEPYSLNWFFPRYGGGRSHEKAITNHLASLCRGQGCFVDVGANLGWFTCIIGCQMRNGEVHSFEIDDQAHAIAEKNVRFNDLQNVSLNLLAVGNEVGKIEYYRKPNSISTMTGITRRNSAYSERVSRKMTSLDAYFGALDYGPDVVKIDVEGTENMVLAGMKNTMRENKPTIILEVHPDRLKKAGSSAEELVGELRRFGYDVFEVQDHRGEASDLSLASLDHRQIVSNTTLYAKNA